MRGRFIYFNKKGRNSSSCVHKNFQKVAFQHFASEMCPAKGNSYEVCGSFETLKDISRLGNINLWYIYCSLQANASDTNPV